MPVNCVATMLLFVTVCAAFVVRTSPAALPEAERLMVEAVSGASAESFASLNLTVVPNSLFRGARPADVVGDPDDLADDPSGRLPTYGQVLE